MNIIRHCSLPLILAGLIGCSPAQKHLQYDFGSAYMATVKAQSDLTRPGAAESAHPLSGIEAAAIRLQVIKSTTDVETAVGSIATLSE